MSEAGTKHSIVEKMDAFLRRQNEISIWAPAVIIGLVLIWSSTFVSLDFIHAPAWNEQGQVIGNPSCFEYGKQVGIWGSPNWSIVYLFLFPLFLILTASLARSVRSMIDAFVDNGLLQRIDGKPPTKSDVHTLLDAELSSTSSMFVLLSVAVTFIALGGWWTSSGKPLWNLTLSGQVVDWTTAIIPCGLNGLASGALVYTALAYLWMGLALFCYLSCLFLGFIYASFLGKLAIIDAKTQDGTAAFRLYFDQMAFTAHFRSFTRTYFMACVLGLLAAYSMRLQSQYLFASEESILAYLTSSVRELFDAAPDASIGRRYQPLDARNQTLATGAAVAAVTLVSLSGTFWILLNAFNSAKKLTTKVLPEDGGVALERSEISSLKRAQFVPTVLPDWAAMTTVAASITGASVFPRSSLLWVFIASIALALLAIAGRLRTHTQSPEPGKNAALPVTFGEKLELEKFVRRRADFVPAGDFIADLRRLMGWICTVETPTGGGTGFLVGPNLLLTNYHVVAEIVEGAASPHSVICRFDFVRSLDAETPASGIEVLLDIANCCLRHRRHSPADVEEGKAWQPCELDYALLQLAEPVGSQVSPLTGQIRGWLSLKGDKATADTKRDDPLIIVQHPIDWANVQEARFLPIQCAFGSVLDFVGDGLRMRHDTSTLPGSSGSPCCSPTLKLVALHHAGDPKDLPNYRGEYNQAIPIKLIIDDLLQQGIVLTEPPPDPTATVPF